jgi:hypothetical protein
MPAKPQWYGRLEQIIGDLEALPCPWITRGTIEFLLGVGPRRAQQILAPCAVEQVGTSLVADRRLLIDHLRRVASGEAIHYESQRQQKVAETIDRFRRQWLEAPKVLVEAPVSAVNQTFEDLPEGVELGPGRIALAFSSPSEALEKLLALAMAIGKNMAQFEDIISPDRQG